jgi:glycosyltransferase involved in cell wall biosynthesis
MEAPTGRLSEKESHTVMKLLLCHNFYQQAGGEDQVFADEAQMLESHGHEIIRYSVHNDAVDDMSRWDVGLRTLWNRTSYREIRGLISRERPDLVHFTNTFPLISPAAYYAAQREGVPVVQSLHNFRLLCPAASFFRNQKPCEDCLGRIVPWPAMLHGCYRSSRMATGAVATLNVMHRLLRTWQKSVDRYIALSHFSANKFIEGGLPEEKIVVKRNFVSPDPGPRSGAGKYAIFVGRLAPEKGLDTLLDAWDQLSDVMPLKILGTGPLDSMVRERAARNEAIEVLDRQPLEEVIRCIGDATCLVLPSGWYENCPKTILEAFAVGTPVVASRLGAQAEMVDHGRTGLHFEPRDGGDLASQIRRLASDHSLCESMRTAVRRQFEEMYTEETNYQQLMDIYQQARRSKGLSSVPREPVSPPTSHATPAH